MKEVRKEYIIETVAVDCGVSWVEPFVSLVTFEDNSEARMHFLRTMDGGNVDCSASFTIAGVSCSIAIKGTTQVQDEVGTFTIRVADMKWEQNCPVMKENFFPLEETRKLLRPLEDALSCPVLSASIQVQSDMLQVTLSNLAGEVEGEWELPVSATVAVLENNFCSKRDWPSMSVLTAEGVILGKGDTLDSHRMLSIRKDIPHAQMCNDLNKFVHCLLDNIMSVHC